MAIGIGDNFKYQGRKPNFARDSFENLDEMKNAGASIMDDGHISYCKSTGETYRFDSNNTEDERTGKWRLFGMRMNIHEVTLTETGLEIAANALKTLEEVYYVSVGESVYTISSDINVKWVDGKRPVATPNSTLVISVVNNLAVWASFRQ